MCAKFAFPWAGSGAGGAAHPRGPGLYVLKYDVYIIIFQTISELNPLHPQPSTSQVGYCGGGDGSGAVSDADAWGPRLYIVQHDFVLSYFKRFRS